MSHCKKHNVAAYPTMPIMILNTNRLKCTTLLQ